MSGFWKSMFGRGRPAASPAEPIFPRPHVHVSEPPEPAAPPGPAIEASEPDELGALSAAAASGDLDATLRLGAKVRASAPDDPAGYVLPARLLRDRGELELADALLHSSESRPPDLLTMITRAEIAFDRRDFPEARRRAEALIAASPEQPLAYVLAAGALREQGRDLEAERVMGLAREALPGDALVLTVWAETAARRADWRYAALRAAELRAAFPDHPGGWRIGADALRGSGREAEAEALMREAADRLPDDRSLLADWARRAIEDRDWPAALERAARLRERAPSDAEGWALGVQATRGAGDLAAARGLVGEALSACGPQASLLAAWADVAADASDWPEAEEATARLREHHPELWIGWFLGARALAEQKRGAEAEALLQAGRGRFAPEPAIEEMWAELALRRGGWAEAAERAERVRALFPQLASGMFVGVEALLGAGRLDDAAALAEEGASRFPQDQVVVRLGDDVARARLNGGAAPARGESDEAAPASAAAAPEPSAAAAVAAALRDNRFDEALRLWHASAQDEQSPFADLLDTALRITLADPWHEGVRALFETLGAEHSTHQAGWRPVVEHAPRVATSPEQFHDWREASAAFLRGAKDGRLDGDTRARWLALVS